MNIAHVNPGQRGLASYCLNLYRYFEKDPDVANLIVSEAKWKKERIEGLYEPRSLYLAQILPVALNKKEVYATLESFKPDILHHHYPCGSLDYHVSRLQTTLNVPLIVTLHLSVGSKKYFVDRVMHGYFNSVKKNYRNATAVVTISKYVRQQVIEMNLVPESKIVLLYAGVDPEIYKPQPTQSDDRLEVLFVGQIRSEKGVDGLIRAVTEVGSYRSIRLSIIGSGNAEARLRRKTKGNPYINWIGFVPNQKDVAKHYANADIVALPTRWDEAFSYIPIEAFSSGTPIVASNVGGTSEIVEHDGTGFLFDVGRFEQLAEILKNVDKKRLKEMGLKARELVLKKFTLSQFGEKYASLYKNVIENPENIAQID